jgi:hypothetical protein
MAPQQIFPLIFLVRKYVIFLVRKYVKLTNTTLHPQPLNANKAPARSSNRKFGCQNGVVITAGLAPPSFSGRYSTHLPTPVSFHALHKKINQICSQFQKRHVPINIHSVVGRVVAVGCGDIAYQY